ncbi:MAG: HAMP domain-containing histidine kinase [Polyangiaceae bacterium]|nr:HAMP domain-containing histidine kinase [Polyangiaceae bacterium]
MRRLPLLPVAPLLVVLIGLAAAATLVTIGLGQIRRTSDSEAQERASAVSAALAARLRLTALEDRGPLLSEIAQDEDIELLLVSQDGQSLANASFETFEQKSMVDMLVAGEGVVQTSSGRQVFASHPLAAPLEHLSVVTMVAAPKTPAETLGLTQAVAAVTAILIGVAAAVTYSYARAAHDEVQYVRAQIAAMADPESDPAGKPVPIRAFDEVGQLAAAFNILVDRFTIAEKSYRADLAEAARIDAERLEFLAGLSHELRTPLNAILGFSHVLESGVDGPLTPDARESIETIRTSGEHLRTLIDDILDLSALETGELKLTRRALDMRVAAEEVIRESGAVARRKGLALRVEGERGVFARADRRRVRQILTNLVANAVKFTPRGHVIVRISRRDADAIVAVEDSGYGIAEEEIEEIFEAYRQSTDARLRQGGAGLGLATVKRLVELHGGTITVTSAMGKGSVFTFSIPLATEEEILVAEATRVSATSMLPDSPVATPLPLPSRRPGEEPR